MNKIFKMKPSEFEIYITLLKFFHYYVYDEKTAENYRNCSVADKTHSFQTIKDTEPKF